MYFYQGLKNLDIQKLIYNKKKFKLKIKIFCLLVYGGIVVKMDHFHLFEEVLKKQFVHKKQWVMKSNNNMVFLLTCTCVLMLSCIL